MNGELKKIKKYYGEEMMHFCRENFSTLFEKEGAVLSILEHNFAHSHELFSDIKKEEKEWAFKNYVYSFYDVEEKESVTGKTPFELMEEAGYNLYECKSKEEILRFKKYYSPGEVLCTFSENRLQTNYVFFAVKKNVDEIKREDFSNPERQDEYGTSVISIQFTRGKTNILSIKNRYNHAVNNPDATFSNNLENIIPGLTASFENEYGFSLNKNNNNFELEYYVEARDGKFYKYNYEMGNIYYGPNNIVIDQKRNVLEEFLSKEKYLIFERYILDIVNKKVYTLHDDNVERAFLDVFQNIEKIDITKEKNNKEIKITSSDKEIGTTILTLDKRNAMIAFQNDTIRRVSHNFLREFIYLKSVSMKNLTIIDDWGFQFCFELENVDFPSLEVIGEYSLTGCKVKHLLLPNVNKIEQHVMQSNEKLETLELENCQSIGDCSFTLCYNLKEIILPNVEEIGESVFHSTSHLEKITLPKVRKVKSDFLTECCALRNAFFPRLEVAGNAFLERSPKLIEFYAPMLKKSGDDFLREAKNLTHLSLPNIKQLKDFSLETAYALQSFCAPNLEKIGVIGFCNSKKIKPSSFYAPNLRDCNIDVFLNNSPMQEEIRKICYSNQHEKKIKTKTKTK